MAVGQAGSVEQGCSDGLGTVSWVGTLDVEGRRVVWSVVGSGPALLAPECNYRWTPSMLRTMSRTFAVVTVSPSDFGASDRPGAPYVADRWVADVRAVLDHLGIDHCAVFGYSFTGAFGPWLAQHLPERVTAVAAGGFPLLGSYAVTADDVRGQLAALEADPATYAAVDRERFDPRAGSAFYDALAALPDDALVDRCPCPLYCFWGEHDTDAVALVMPSDVLSAGLTARRVPHQVIPGVDHEGLNARLELAWPGVEAWLWDQVGAMRP